MKRRRWPLPFVVLSRCRFRELQDKASGGWECLEMIRERLEWLGMDMKGCPPMMYDDAIKSLAFRLGKCAGLVTWADVHALVKAGNPSELIAAPSPASTP